MRCAAPPSSSRKDLFHHAARHIRQPELPALEQIRELLVIDPHQMQNRRLQVVDMHSALGYVKSVVVGLAMRITAFDAAAGHPQREHPPMMVAAVTVGFERTLRIR